MSDAELVRQGSVWHIPLDPDDPTRGVYKAVALTADWYNKGADPIVAPIVGRRLARDAFPLLIATHEADPVAGLVVIDGIAPVDKGDLAEYIGLLCGLTMSRLGEAWDEIGGRTG